MRKMRIKIWFLIILVFPIKAPAIFSETVNPKDTVGLGRVVANVPQVAWWWNYLRNDPKSKPEDTLSITQKYDTIFTYDINKDRSLDVIATVMYAELPYGAGGPRRATIVALRKDDSLSLHAMGEGSALAILDSLIPQSVILLQRWSYCHGSCIFETHFTQIWPQFDTLLHTSTSSYICSENEKFQFVRLPSSDTLLIVRFFERKCDPEWRSYREKGPERNLTIFRFHDKERSYQEWNPKDEKIWEKAVKAFGPLLKDESLEKLKGE
jgi:hypothetical protein